jgi:hypothetical protein
MHITCFWSLIMMPEQMLRNLITRVKTVTSPHILFTDVISKSASMWLERNQIIQQIYIQRKKTNTSLSSMQANIREQTATGTYQHKHFYPRSIRWIFLWIPYYISFSTWAASLQFLKVSIYVVLNFAKTPTFRTDSYSVLLIILFWTHSTIAGNEELIDIFHRQANCRRQWTRSKQWRTNRYFP